MREFNPDHKTIVSPRTVRHIRYGVIAGHLLTVLMILASSVVTEWFDRQENVITVEFYDPALDNIVDNPSPDPDPDNPEPPSGTQDGAEPDNPAPDEPLQQDPEINEEPPKILEPQTAVPMEQPAVNPRKLPKPEINNSLPKPKEPPKTQAIKQPKAKKRKLPAKKTDTDSKKSSRESAANKSQGPRGSNLKPGHNAPGGQRGNSGYDTQVAMMIKRMWVTPDSNRLGGRTPQVTIYIKIAPSGQIISKRIIKKSGVLAMDESIAALLNQLHKVIKPFDNQDHELVFILKAEDI